MPRTTALLVTALAAPIALAPAQQPRADQAGLRIQSTQLPDGPLLALQTVDDASKQRTLWLADVFGEAPAAPAVRARGALEILHRLDRDRLLLTSHAEPRGLVVADVAAGTHRTLAPGAPRGFVAVRGDEVLFLGDGRAGEDFLFRASWREATPRVQVLDVRLSRVVSVVGNLALAVRHDGRAIWLVNLLRGGGRELAQLPEQAHAPRLQLSPTGQWAAIGFVDLGGGGAVLRIVDVATGRLLREWTGMPVEVSPLSSSMPTLEIGWSDEATVACSESRNARRPNGTFCWVRRDVLTGDVLGEETYGPVGLSHQAPPAPSSAQPQRTPGERPRFLAERGELRLEGREQEVCDPRRELRTHDWQDVSVDPSGHHAAVRRRADGADFLELYTAPPRTGDPVPPPRRLLTGYARDLRWLPAP